MAQQPLEEDASFFLKKWQRRLRLPKDETHDNKCHICNHHESQSYHGNKAADTLIICDVSSCIHAYHVGCAIAKCKESKTNEQCHWACCNQLGESCDKTTNPSIINLSNNKMIEENTAIEFHFEFDKDGTKFEIEDFILFRKMDNDNGNGNGNGNGNNEFEQTPGIGIIKQIENNTKHNGDITVDVRMFIPKTKFDENRNKDCIMSTTTRVNEPNDNRNNNDYNERIESFASDTDDDVNNVAINPNEFELYLDNRRQGYIEINTKDIISKIKVFYDKNEWQAFYNEKEKKAKKESNQFVHGVFGSMGMSDCDSSDNELENNHNNNNNNENKYCFNENDLDLEGYFCQFKIDGKSGKLIKINKIQIESKRKVRKSKFEENDSENNDDGDDDGSDFEPPYERRKREEKERKQRKFDKQFNNAKYGKRRNGRHHHHQHGHGHNRSKSYRSHKRKKGDKNGSSGHGHGHSHSHRDSRRHAKSKSKSKSRKESKICKKRSFSEMCGNMDETILENSNNCHNKNDDHEDDDDDMGLESMNFDNNNNNSNKNNENKEKEYVEACPTPPKPLPMDMGDRWQNELNEEMQEMEDIDIDDIINSGGIIDNSDNNNNNNEKQDVAMEGVMRSIVPFEMPALIGQDDSDVDNKMESENDNDNGNNNGSGNDNLKNNLHNYNMQSALQSVMSGPSPNCDNNNNNNNGDAQRQETSQNGLESMNNDDNNGYDNLNEMSTSLIAITNAPSKRKDKSNNYNSNLNSNNSENENENDNNNNNNNNENSNSSNIMGNINNMGQVIIKKERLRRVKQENNKRESPKNRIARLRRDLAGLKRQYKHYQQMCKMLKDEIHGKQTYYQSLCQMQKEKEKQDKEANTIDLISD